MLPNMPIFGVVYFFLIPDLKIFTWCKIKVSTKVENFGGIRYMSVCLFEDFAVPRVNCMPFYQCSHLFMYQR